jgi:hypothetical protein
VEAAVKSGVAPDNAPVAAARSAGRAPPLLRGTVFIRSENQYSYGMSLSRQATTQNLQVRE